MESVGADQWQKAVQQLLDVRRPAQAEQLVRRHLAQNPQDAGAHVLLAVALVRQEQYAPAAQAARQAIALDPQLADGYYLLGVAQLHENKPADALRNLREALRLDTCSATYWGYKAVIHNTRREPTLALQAAETGLAHDPTDLECLFQRILALRKLQRFREAGTGIARLARQHPDSALAHRLLGENARRDLQPLRAETHLREALRLAPSDPVAQQLLIELVLERGELALAKERYAEAIACFQEVLRLDPTLVVAQMRLRQATRTTLWWHQPQLWAAHWTASMQRRRFSPHPTDKLILAGQAIIYSVLLLPLGFWYVFSLPLDWYQQQEVVPPTDGWFFGGLFWSLLTLLSAWLLPLPPALVWLLVAGGLVFPVRNAWRRFRRGERRFPLGAALLLSPGGNALLNAYDKAGNTNALSECRGFLACVGAFLLLYQLFRPEKRP